MLSIKRQSSKPSHVTKHRRRHRSHKRHHYKSWKIRPLNKVSPLNDNKISSVTTIDHHSPSLKRLRRRSNIATRSLSVSRVRRPSQLLSKTNSNHFDSSLFNNRIVNTIYLCPKQTRSHRDYDQVFNWKKEQKKQEKRNKLCSYCCLCSPLCSILSMLTAILLATIIATVIVAVLTKNKSSTISITTITNTSIITTSTSTSSTSTTTTTTTAMICGFSCLSQTWISSADLLAKWIFDDTFMDQTDTYNATAVNNPTFTANGYVNQALVLDATSNQYLYTSYISRDRCQFHN